MTDSRFISIFDLRRVFLFFFLLTLSCSKDESEDKADIVIPSYQVSVQSSEGGSVSTTGGTYQSGGSLSVTATPNDGYKFTGWSGDASGTVNPLTINVSGNANITANFERIKYELNVAIEGKGKLLKRNQFFKKERNIILVRSLD